MASSEATHATAQRLFPPSLLRTSCGTYLTRSGGPGRAGGQRSNLRVQIGRTCVRLNSWEESMHMGRLLQLAAVGLVVALLASAAPQLAAQNQAPAALTGQVTSEAEGAMEGVVVSAKKADSIVTVSVITNAQGRYSFPASRLPAGKYTLKIRAIGYNLAGPASADVLDEQTATADLKLRKAKNLAAQ